MVVERYTLQKHDSCFAIICNGVWCNSAEVHHTRPKLRFPTCPAYQNMTFPHISYTYLTEDRAEFHANT